MLAAHAKHPNCAYLWMNWVSSPKVQAEQALSFGETPANTKACSFMEQIKKGSCTAVSRERSERVLQQHQVLEDAGGGMRKWSERLRRLQQVAAEVDGSDGIAYGQASSPAAGVKAKRTVRVRVSAALFRRPWARAALLLSVPGAWFVLIYLAALVLLFISALWSVESFSGKLIHSWTLENFETLVTVPVYRTIALRTVGIAAAVTVTDALLALPFAFFAVRIAPKRLRAALFVAVLIPLWSSYLVRVYVWRLILAKDGILNWTLENLGLGSLNIGYSNWAMWIVFSYIWLPFMILPIWSAIERVPDSYIEASADLGARGWRTFRSVLLPLILPGIAAGSIFTFALTLGRLHHAHARRRSGLRLYRERRLPECGGRQQRAICRRIRDGAARGHGHLPPDRATPGSVRSAVIGTGRWSRVAFAAWAVLIMLFLFVPIALIILYAFNPSNVQSWPLEGLSTKWFSSTWHNAEMRHALWLSIRAGVFATAIALLLGSMGAFAVHRFRFFGRETISFIFVLPLALPGIITGMALNSFISFNGVNFLACYDRHRSRHLLHRCRIQQRARAPAPHANLTDRGLDGPGR